MWISVIQVLLLNERSKPGFSSFSFILFTCISSREHTEPLTCGLGLPQGFWMAWQKEMPSERNDFCTEGRFFFFRCYLVWRLLFFCQKAKVIHNNFLLPLQRRRDTELRDDFEEGAEPQLVTGSGSGIFRACTEEEQTFGSKLGTQVVKAIKRGG